MYCPTCGSEERQLSQFCRACGTDLRVVRMTLERPDSITESAVSARDQIGRAVADKIRMTESAKELHKVAEDVLPEIEKFLESPAEKRLRRLRAGIIMAFIGLGVLMASVFLSMHEEDMINLIIPGMVAFCIGMGIMVNGLLFTVPRKKVADNSEDAWRQRSLDSGAAAFKPASQLPEAATNELDPVDRRTPSVTEHTTHQLKVNR